MEILAKVHIIELFSPKLHLTLKYDCAESKAHIMAKVHIIELFSPKLHLTLKYDCAESKAISI